MMNHSLKSLCKLSPGTIIQGKWHKKQYRIIKELGFGANGIVYLAQLQNRFVALKMSDNSMSIISEVNVLKSFAKVQGTTLGPSLLDVDDWICNGKQVAFYTMEYIKGPDFLSYISQKGADWTYVLMLQLLADLDQLHQNGWVFGDLKPENLIVAGHPPKIRCIDVGGTTIQGRAIKEFTEFYDRGYWGLGSRKAEPSYDLFSLAMIIINTAYPKRFNKTTGGIAQLKQMIEQKKELNKVAPVLLNALQGVYPSAAKMRSDILVAINPNPESSRKDFHSERRKTIGQTRAKHIKQKKQGSLLETSLIVAGILLLYFFYIFGQVL